jgi:hypothetical protein
MEENPVLRAELSRLTAESPNDVIGHSMVRAWLEKQIQEVIRLRPRYPHDIEVEVRWTPAITNLNCYMYALRINDDAIAEWRFPGAQPDTRFILDMLGSRMLRKKPLAKAGAGDIAVYFEPSGRPRHAGIFHDNKIISKWGNGATHIWRHGMWEVPSDYGNRIACLTALVSTENAIQGRDGRQRGLDLR